MASTVQLRRSAVPNTPPTTSQLALGELAINTYDGKLFLKKNVSGNESIIEIGAAIGGGGGTVTSVVGTGTVNGLTLTGSITSSGNLTLGGTLSLTSSDITTGLGYTPYNSTNPAGYALSSNTVSTTTDQTITGIKTIAAATDYTTNKLRNTKLMTSTPTAGDFNGNGDIIFVYTP